MGDQGVNRKRGNLFSINENYIEAGHVKLLQHFLLNEFVANRHERCEDQGSVYQKLKNNGMPAVVFLGCRGCFSTETAMTVCANIVVTL